MGTPGFPSGEIFMIATPWLSSKNDDSKRIGSVQYVPLPIKPLKPKTQ